MCNVFLTATVVSRESCAIGECSMKKVQWGYPKLVLHSITWGFCHPGRAFHWQGIPCLPAGRFALSPFNPSLRMAVYLLEYRPIFFLIQGSRKDQYFRVRIQPPRLRSVWNNFFYHSTSALRTHHRL